MSWTIILLFVCLITNVTINAQNPVGLKVSAALRGFPIGTSATVNNLRNYVDNGEYNWKIANNYQLVVPEGELKPRSIWFGENIYNFTDPDWLLGATPNTTGWIQKNQMQLRGHNLVWALDQCIPDWLIKQESTITPDKAKQLLSDYIHAVVGRYRGKILWWDVVNEAIDDKNNTNPLNLRDCFWFRKLGPDFIKYAFMFAQEADPDLQLYYNEYGIETLGLKANRAMDLINWVRSQGATIHGIGLQWHINVSINVTAGDEHYQSAQRFIDNKLDIMVTELDVALPTRGGYPVDSKDLDRQGFIYRSLMQYVLYFSYHCKAMLTWGFTDRYSWLPYVTKKTLGDALPFDWMYEPKPAYWQMQEEMARVVLDGTYRLSPPAQPDKCLGISQNTTSSDVQLYTGDCNNAYEKWNITWLGDGTYRFSSEIDNNRVLGAYNTTASIGGVRTYNWSNDVNQEWAFSPQKNNTFRIVPRLAWWRVMNVYNTSDIGIINYNNSIPQNWILTSV
jgi:endo-1,4-beta-xylanase